MPSAGRPGNLCPSADKLVVVLLHHNKQPRPYLFWGKCQSEGLFDRRAFRTKTSTVLIKKYFAMKPVVNRSLKTCGLTLIPAFSRQNGRRSKNPRPRLRGRGWHGVPGEGLAAVCARFTSILQGRQLTASSQSITR